MRDWTDASLPNSLRDLRVARFSLEERNGTRLTFRFALAAPSKLVRYCDCQAEPADGGSVLQYHLRGPWRPRTAGLMVLGLLCVQMVYELLTGTFDRVTVIIAVVVPSITALLAQVSDRMIRTKYRLGMMDALHLALHIVPDTSASSPRNN